MFIYLITNAVNGKVYVGRTQKTVEARWRLHCKSAIAGSRLAIHQAIRKYGFQSFSISILASPETIEEFERLEKHFISLYHSTNRNFGYNRTAGGNGFSGLHTEESRKKMRTSHLGKLRSQKSRAKQAQTMRTLIREGRVVSPRRLGKRWSTEQKELRRQKALQQWAEVKANGRTKLG